MFERPDEWARTREIVSVFEFIQPHTTSRPEPGIGPNTYDALVRAGAFRQLAAWDIRIAVEAGAVKDVYCTRDPSGMTAAVANTLTSIEAVAAAGGTVSYLALDAPFLAGRSHRCGGPSLLPTADRLATYVAAVHARYPGVRIGLVEAYPAFAPDEFAEMLGRMRERNIDPAFLHVAVDLRALRPDHDDLARDIRRLGTLANDAGVPFGAIVRGDNGDADTLFALDAERLAAALKQAFPEAGAMPDQLIVQSRAGSRTGRLITPSNLPENRAYTLTNLLWQVVRRFLE